MMKRIFELYDNKTKACLGTFHLVRPCAKKVKELIDNGTNVLIISYYLVFNENGEVSKGNKRVIPISEIFNK